MKRIIPFPRTRLSLRILLWSFVPTTIILLAVAFTIYYAYQRVTEDLVVGRNQQLTRLSARQLSGDLDQYVNTLAGLTRSADLYSGVPARQAALLKQSANALMIFDAGVLVLNPAGKVVVIEPDQPGMVGQEWSNRPFFRQLIRNNGSSSEPAFSDILSGDPSNREIVAVAVPILDDRQDFQGVLVGMFRLGASHYSAFYGGLIKLRLSENGSTYLVDGVGRVIYHPDEAQIGSDLHFQPDVQQVIKRQAGYLRSFDPSGHEILASFAPVPGTPWGLVDEEDWQTLLSSSRGYGQFLFLLLGLGIVIPTLVVMLGVQRITGPVAQLISGAKEIAGGKYGQQIRVHTGDELEDLVTQFNRMSEQLHESYSELENRVEARTRELATLNTTAAVASRSLNLNEIAQDALDVTLKALDLDTGAAFDLAADGQSLRFVAERNLAPDFPYLTKARPLIGSELEKALAAGQPSCWLADEFPDAVVRPWLSNSGIVQVITIPLLAKGKLVGVFNLGSRQFREIHAEERTLMAAIGQQIGVAVENAHLYRQSEETATLAERTRLARELHDSVTQSLYSVTLFAEAAASQLAAGDSLTAQEHLVDLRNTAQEALREMRLLIFELRPLALEKNGLCAALQERLEAVEGRGGMKSEFHLEGEEHLPLEVQQELYHIAQEGLNNVLKHAHANRVQVEIRISDEAVNMTITDDGVGFNPTQVRPGGMGLESMRARASQMGGRLTLESKPGMGTKLCACIPLLNGKIEKTEERDG